MKLLLITLGADLLLARLAGEYMAYFDIGVNNASRSGEVLFFLLPALLGGQALSVAIPHIRRLRGHPSPLGQAMAVGTATLLLAVCFVLTHKGIPRTGGILRFLGHLFFGLDAGEIADGL